MRRCAILQWKLPGGRVARGSAVLALLLGLAGGASGAVAETGSLIGARAASRPVAATAAALEQTDETAKLSFDLSGPVAPTVFALADPDRIIIDVPNVDFRLDPQAGRVGPAPAGGRRRIGRGGEGLITSFRFGLLAPGKSRVVVDLGAPVRVVRASSETDPATHASRLVLELARTDAANFRASLKPQAVAAPATATAVNAPADRAQKPVIVIDPGHGGVDSGAMVNGLVEKYVVFDFAKTLAERLTATGRFKVVMTRTEDVFVPLGERVRLAHEANADLFVSVHADTVPEATAVAGATIYTASDKASDAEAARVADKENQADAQAGLDGREETPGVSDILFDLTRRETRAYSHVFARDLMVNWKLVGRLNKNPERAAGFRVLKAPDVPSVLLELGYLSNPQDAAALTSTTWRDKATAQVTAAIVGFFIDRGPVRAEAPAAADPDRQARADVVETTQTRTIGAGSP
jgi:N-acetylmuramoyl-L-alanine amidase